jgi:hypothetical protein
VEYSYFHHFLHENRKVPTIIADTFWGDKDVQSIMLHHRFENNAISYVPLCFKKECECRFLSPFCYNPFLRIDPEDTDPDVVIPWHQLSDPKTVWLSPWMLIPQWDLGCECINSYNLACSDVFNHNTNMQIGNISQVCYSTLYGSKSTQKEDKEKKGYN